ncbi:MAG TPA: UpxY family transcription antiterminator [Chitinophagaceae bacterium]|nr:UpxY family transcription antiterminator [Chitinophagaceae bacterium]
MNENKKWFAVYTRPRWEKKVAETLTHRKIECYCPINKVVRQWSDRKKIVHEPLFTSYVFVRVPDTEIISLRQASGVINIVYWLGKPAIIRDSEIEVIKRFLYEHVNIKLEKTPINVNDRVRILGGPLMELEGQVLSIKNKTVKVVLPSLGYMMFAEVETANVEVTQPSVAKEIEMRYPLYAAK